VQPAFSVFWGESIDHAPPSAAHVASMPPSFLISSHGYAPPERRSYAGVPELGRHIIESLIADRFDVTSMQAVPVGRHGYASMPHAYGFVYRRIMRDRVVPNVPVVLNTFYPPNQPTVERCHEFGRSVARAIRGWKSDARVALIASGGLTHFVVDEEVDQRILEAMRTNRISDIAALGEATFQSGTSEIKNWIPVVGAMGELGFPMTLVDYVPCYRSEAGTGNAMGFASWEAA
jgi:3-O-methylgallate 3,4-dioxygenase